MRAPRIDLPDIPYHVFSRGDNKERIFFDERDRLTYLKILREAREKFSFELYTYALMDNHFHLLLKMLGNSSLSALMHRVLLFYSMHINRKYGRVGHVFQGRFHSILVDTDRYFLTVDRYIHMNAPRAGMVAKPEDHPWSSYNSRLRQTDTDWLTHEPVLSYFGPPQSPGRIAAYKKFTDDALGTEEEWSEKTLRATRYLGSLDFVRKVQHLRELQSQEKRQLHASLDQVQSSDVVQI